MPFSVVLLLLAFTSLANAVEPPACTLRMAAETDFPPHLIKQQEQWSGLSVELMQRLAREVNCQLVFINSPWLRSLQMSEHGELDILSHLSFSEQRKAHFAFIGPHHIESIYLVGDPTRLPAAAELQQLASEIDFGSIATLHGGYYGEEFQRLTEQKAFSRQLVSISSIQDKLALLRAGRVNAILEDVSVLRYWQQHSYPDAERYQPLIKVYQSPVYFGFSKTSLSTERLQILVDTWQRLYLQGELAAIYKKYQIDNYAELQPAPRL
ncbi:substrate-binding periplasmic protein [Rheinheimera maricola]|uniref:Transporter substrate-binding domain-containing protein n=1 Tax=Rheinheimera maricola TaxID=2793282 RepID=A0ABS7X3D7_9GAMM|nr:transporter substrate-binding domain-containing protein [Rheinheimera maricola]MBZ9610076.1 transporter substrate-binding domain-containing protein [Rheinheimera maricola]